MVMTAFPSTLNVQRASWPWFVSRGDDMPVATECMLHETAGAGDPIPTLVRRKLGIHLVIEPSGLVRQHANLLARLDHVGSHNGVAIGVEVINPYYPGQRPRKGPWEHVIDAPWAHHLKGEPKGYVVPTLAWPKRRRAHSSPTGSRRGHTSASRSIGIGPADRVVTSCSVP